MSNFVDDSRFYIEYGKEFLKKIINANISRTWPDRQKLKPYLESTRQY